MIVAFKDRFGVTLKEEDFVSETSHVSENGDTTQAISAPQPREILLTRARQWMRKELTDLEQFVLIQIFDQSWKDHLYAMDLLKAGIGLHAFAERDPRVLYKKEGYRYFEEMMSGVRDKVTQMIFRARVGRQQPTAKSAYKETAAVHDAGTGYGVRENIQANQAAMESNPSESDMQQAASQTQGEAPAKVKPIVRTIAKVGRNDPCPCGSGKKYKKCCGVNAV
jgi:preprotein translocase subunit SecA